VSPVDCLLQKQDGTWRPVGNAANGVPTCEQNKCSMRSATTEEVVAKCSGPQAILNGFIDPRQVYSAEIKEVAPIILNGFAMPHYEAIVKKGGQEVVSLSQCTGRFDNWTLRCTPGPNAPLGVSHVFELSDQANKKASYKSGVVSPTAPVEEHAMKCTLTNP
jgi:hypothetical protein